MEIGILIVGWIIYFFIHSFLADEKVKTRVRNLTDQYYKYYRLVYVLISTVGLLALLFWNSNIPSENYFNNSGVVRYLSLMFVAFGVIVIKIAFRFHRISSFIGLTPEDSHSLMTKGILGSVRHPIYSGTILIVIGYWLFSPNLPTLLSAICMLAYLPIGIYFEEKKLINEFGEQYLKYKREVPALFPQLF